MRQLEDVKSKVEGDPDEVGISIMDSGGFIRAKVHAGGKIALITKTEDTSHAGYLYCLDEVASGGEKHGYEGRIFGGSGMLKRIRGEVDESANSSSQEGDGKQ